MEGKGDDFTIKTLGSIAEEFMLKFLMQNNYKKLILCLCAILGVCAIIILTHSSYKKPKAYVNLMTVPPSILENPRTLYPQINVPIFNTQTSLRPFFNQTITVFGNQNVSMLKDRTFPSKISKVPIITPDHKSSKGHFPAAMEENNLDAYKKYGNFKQISDLKKR